MGSDRIAAQTAVHTVISFLTSETFGFLLKVFAGLTAAGFGIFGIGTKTRKDDGRLSRNGWITLVGIVVAGSLAIGTSIYEFSSGQKKQRDEQQKERESRLKGERLLLSVQRGIYPLKGITLSFSLVLGKEYKPFGHYLDNLKKVISRDPKVTKREEYEWFASDSDDNPIYRVASTSALFPREGTDIRAALDNIGLTFQLLKKNQSSEPQGKVHEYENLGTFGVRLADGKAGNLFLIFNPSKGGFSLRVEDYELDDKVPISSGVYSVVDFSPGAIAAGATVFLTPLFQDFRKLDFDLPEAVRQANSIRNAVKLTSYVHLQFKYPKSIDIGEPFSVVCREQDYVARLLPEMTDEGNRLGIPAKTLPEANQKRLCAALVSTDNKPVK
jgi:hypothetical protein